MAIIGDYGYWPYTLGRSVRLYTDGCVVDSCTGLMAPCIPMEGSGGITIPYLGYIEATLNIPEVKAFQEDCLFLVVNDHTYGKHVPITVGTLHIDMIIDQATKEELEQISIAWG